MNLIDIGAIVLIALAVMLGLRSGALPQLAGLTGAAIGAVVGFVVLPVAAPLLDPLDPVWRAVIVLSVLLGLVGLGEGLGATAGRTASHALGVGLLGALDRVAGALVGGGQALLIVWLAGGVLASGPFPTFSREAQNSVAVRVLDTVLPPPTELVLELGHLLDNTGIPDVFIGLEQLPAQDIALPSEGVARQIGQAAAGSVLRVVADGCDLRSSGSGFVISDHYIVTNAHVVAGATQIVVQTSAASYDAVPVLVDLELDIALLHVPDLDAPVLHFVGQEPSRGAIGATFGYPGGGNAVVEPATVAAVYDATGLDVTGSARVTRRIIELRATIQPGDSGGPLLLQDGSVGGVVFAESKVDPSVGYALSPVEVSQRIADSLSKTQQVDTGPCIH
ncbi:MAG TPA: MarP family serine protease [Candidatus Limnocylindrales bacterium]|nr:MarP family serine protease [Candidatus Limnocylindrales bacterium]